MPIELPFSYDDDVRIPATPGKVFENTLKRFMENAAAAERVDAAAMVQVVSKERAAKAADDIRAILLRCAEERQVTVNAQSEVLKAETDRLNATNALALYDKKQKLQDSANAHAVRMAEQVHASNQIVLTTPNCEKEADREHALALRGLDDNKEIEMAKAKARPVGWVAVGFIFGTVFGVAAMALAT